jgi:hypothetical protein
VFIQELMERKISAWSLTEFDAEWVNPATRKDIQFLVEEFKGQVFGLKFWKWKFIKDINELKDCPNFEIDLIFQNQHEERVRQIIDDYEKRRGQGWSVKLDEEVIDSLFKLAEYSCTWV